MNKTIFAALMALAFAGAAQAQTNNCPCNGGQGSLLTARTSPTLSSVIKGKMACGNVGGERWQEWHSPAGKVVDYKLGPNHPVDPSKEVGSYTVGADRVTYDYGPGASYAYGVCLNASNYTFCGAQYGGRDITGVIVGGSGSLTSCNAVANSSGTSRTK